MKTISDKPVNYYVYSTPKVFIKWNNFVQPLGYFKTANEAIDKINSICSVPNELKRYSVITPNGNITFE